MNARLFALLAVFSLCTLVALPSPALAGPGIDDDEIPVSIDDGGRLVVRGRIVAVQVTFTCAITGAYDVYMILELAPGNGYRTANGDGTANGHCTAGETVSRSVRINANELDRFRAGPAFATAVVSQDRQDFRGIENGFLNVYQ